MPGFAPLVSEKQILRIVLALVALAGVVFAGQEITLSLLESDWAATSGEHGEKSRLELQSLFDAYQAEAEQVVTQALGGVSLEPDGAGSRAALFHTLGASARNGVTLELYDREKEIRAWSGNRGPLIDTARLAGSKSSFVLQGPIYSYLIVSLPIVEQGRIGGYLLGKRLFDVNFPINNRFISSKIFTSAFTSQLKSLPEFWFPASSAPSADSTTLPVTLRGIHGADIGMALLARPMLSSKLDEVRQTARMVLGMISLLLVLVVGALVIPRLQSRLGWLLGALGWTLFLWASRYLFVWLEFPKSLFFASFFDPVHFASPFGFGIAQSLGDVFLSSLALLLNVLLIVVPGVKRLRSSYGEPPPPRGGGLRILSWISLPVLALLFFLFLRGFLATIHSAVFDSGLAYNDPASLLPSAEVAAMLVSLFFLSFALVSAGVGILLAAYYAVRGAAVRLHPFAAWSLVAGFMLALSFIFGSVYHHSLISQESRALLLVAGVLLSAWTVFWMDNGCSVVAGAAAFALASIAVLVPPLDAKVHELDRDHVELMAHEILRPADGWLSFVMNRALDELSQGDAAGVLRGGESREIEKLAFTQWAGSILSREGNNCSVTFVDVEGSVVSDLHIGIAQQWFRRHHMDEMPRSTRLVEVDDRGEEGGIVKWYRGYAPVYSPDSLFLGGVWIDLSGVNQRMLRGESEEILRNSSREDFAAHHRKLFFFEYFDGNLVASTAEKVSLLSPLPAELGAGVDSAEGIWLEKDIDGEGYEMYFLPDGTRMKSASWIALGMERLDLRWHIYSFLRYASFFLLLVVGLLACLVAGQLWRGERVTADFRTRLLAAFLVVSLIPVVILGYYDRSSATERAAQSTEKELSRQTSVVAAELERKLGVSTPSLLARISDEQCEELAGAMDIDFNVYAGSDLHASSKPEMFMAELLDRSLSAGAYLNVVIGRKNFYAEGETIGSLPYIVGYRPLLAETGSLVGVVSVPTLYSRNAVETELTERNAFLYGAYAFALLMSIIVGSIFAGQISSPVRRLKRATMELAKGNMDIELRRSGTGELGELEEAFASMASKLARVQEQVLKAQKEIAWKEMAQQVAHEIKNPLTPMKLSVQHLRQAYRDKVADFGDVLGRVTTTVLEQIDALSRIASEFSAFARMPERKTEEVDVHPILLEANNLFHLGGITFVLDLRADRSVVLADREELRRVFINIIRNSVQAMGGVGEIRVSTARSGDRLEIVLHDNGPGIPEETRKRLFEPNFSTKTDGMGLGLTIVQTALRNMGGTIEIESSSGKGTTVLLRLPAAPR